MEYLSISDPVRSSNRSVYDYYRGGGCPFSATNMWAHAFFALSLIWNENKQDTQNHAHLSIYDTNSVTYEGAWGTLGPLSSL